jgi:hypothetical protein
MIPLVLPFALLSLAAFPNVEQRIACVAEQYGSVAKPLRICVPNQLFQSIHCQNLHVVNLNMLEGRLVERLSFADFRGPRNQINGQKLSRAEMDYF